MDIGQTVTVQVSKDGRFTLPIEARRVLGLSEGGPVLVEMAGAYLKVIPAVILPAKDAWAFTVEHRQELAEARADAAEGRLSSVTKGEMVELLGKSVDTGAALESD